MTPTPLRVLVVEDNPDDAELVAMRLIEDGFRPDWRRVETEADYRAAIETPLDMILADYTLPQFNALRALHILQERGLDIPFIVVTGSIGEEAAVECMKQGAADYLLKDRLARLGPAVARALEEKRMRDERARIEEQMRRQEQLAVIGQLADGIAHDFNNLLSAIILYAQRPLKKANLPPDVRQAFEIIISESRHASQLIRQILDFSRRVSIETRPLALSPFINDSLKVLRHIIPENILFHLEVGPEEYVVDADSTRIRQALMNLVLNARDAMPDGGDLHIQLERIALRPGQPPPLPEMEGEEWVCLSVADTGCGMTDEVKAHLFEPFFTTKPPGRGVGLGLMQVRAAVEQHGGHIGVESQPGRGTTFRIYLPARIAPTPAPPPPPKAAVTPEGQAEAILLVEDNAELRRVTRAILDSLGYRVLAAANGREALETCRAAREIGQEIALVLTDMVMPEMGGQELIRELRKLVPNIKVLAFTGYALGEEMAALVADQIQGVIQKPFEIDTLAAAIRDALRNS